VGIPIKSIKSHFFGLKSRNPFTANNVPIADRAKKNRDKTPVDHSIAVNLEITAAGKADEDSSVAYVEYQAPTHAPKKVRLLTDQGKSHLRGSRSQ